MTKGFRIERFKTNRFKIERFRIQESMIDRAMIDSTMVERTTIERTIIEEIIDRIQIEELQIRQKPEGCQRACDHKVGIIKHACLPVQSIFAIELLNAFTLPTHAPTSAVKQLQDCIRSSRAPPPSFDSECRDRLIEKSGSVTFLSNSGEQQGALANGYVH